MILETRPAIVVNYNYNYNCNYNYNYLTYQVRKAQHGSETTIRERLSYYSIFIA